MRRIQLAFVVFPLLAWSATASGQTVNALTSQEKTQGWQLLFDGKTLSGWHPSAPAPSRAGAPQPAAQPTPPGTLPAVGTAPTPCVAGSKGSAPAGTSHWEVVAGSLT